MPYLQFSGNAIMTDQNSRYLTPDEIRRFKEITHKVKGIELTNEQAEDQLSRLIKCFEMFNHVGIYNNVAKTTIIGDNQHK